MAKSQFKTFNGAVQTSALLVSILFLVEAVDMLLRHEQRLGLAAFGIVPRTIPGLAGIAFSPLLHASTAHLLANALPLFVLLALLASLGPGLWITALNVKYRDFRYVIPFLVQFGLYVSPVGFSSSVIPAHWRFVYSLNPIVGVIDGFRWSILGVANPIYWPGFILSVAVVVCFLWRGIARFRKMERTFADLI